MRCFASLYWPERAKYYSGALKGLHLPNFFTELWNRTYTQHPITFWDRDIRYLCPPGWSYILEQTHPVLQYEGEETSSQAFNILIRGPTTADCGMVCQIAPIMAIRYVIGDNLFDERFKFQNGQLRIQQNWDMSILEPFLDHPLHYINSQPRFQIKTFQNYPNYLGKHPGGEGRLQNIVQIDSSYLVFAQGGTQNILSGPELESRLFQDYNKPRDFADLEKLRMYEIGPDYVHPDFAPKTFGTLAKEAEAYGDHVLTRKEWEESRAERERMSRGLHRIFNSQRLFDCLRDKDASFDGNVLLMAKKMKIHYLVGKLRSECDYGT